jgi:hypothetical protein
MTHRMKVPSKPGRASRAVIATPTKESKIVTDSTSVTMTRDIAPGRSTVDSAGRRRTSGGMTGELRAPIPRAARATRSYDSALTQQGAPAAHKASATQATAASAGADALVDVRAELATQFGVTDAGSTASIVLAEGITTHKAGASWHMRVDLPALEGGPTKVLALAAVLHAAALQVRVLNSTRTLSVNYCQGIRDRAVHGDVVRLYSQTEADRTSYRFEKGSGRQGLKWGDDEFLFEVIGTFVYIGDETRGGVTRALLAQLPASSSQEVAA